MEIAGIVLAAGEGKKMFPYELTRQKCAISILNEPVVRRCVRLLQRQGVSPVIVVTGHHAGQVREAVGGLPNLLCVQQNVRDGTATGTLLALSDLSEFQHFVLCYGDTVWTEGDLKRTLDAYRDGDGSPTVLLQPLKLPLDSSDWIGAHLDGTRLTRIEGHPRGAPYRLANIFVFNRDAVRFLESNPGVMRSVPVGGMPPIEHEFAQSLQMMIDHGCRIAGVEALGFVIDIDKPWHILEASAALVDEFTQQVQEDEIALTARIDDSADIDGRLVLGEGCVIGKRVVVHGFLYAEAGTQVTNGAIVRGRVVTGKGCHIRDYCLLGDAILGNRCVVGHGAEFEGVAFNTVYLYHYCEIYGVLGEAVDIGAATVCGTLRFDDRETVHNVRGRREVPPAGANASYIGDFSRTGVNAILMPGVKVGAYCCVGPGVVLYNDLPHRTLALVRQEMTHRGWGPERYGW